MPSHASLPRKAGESLGLEVAAAGIPLHSPYPSGPSLHHNGADITLQHEPLQLYCRERTPRLQTGGLKAQMRYLMQTRQHTEIHAHLTFPGKKTGGEIYPAKGSFYKGFSEAAI